MPPDLQITIPYQASAPIGAWGLVLNLLLATLLASILGGFYRRFGRTIANRHAGSRALIFVTLTTVLMISVVKSSPALTLALVGALSVIRYRTPVKDSEELAYVIFAVGVGVGLGAGQPLATVIGFIVILGVIWIRSAREGKPERRNLFISMKLPDGESPESAGQAIQGLLEDHVTVVSRHLLDAERGELKAAFSVKGPDDPAIVNAVERIRGTHPAASLRYVDDAALPGL
jgi:uncharacterized membrane protein YhiD involved in acid resistance